MFHVKLNESFVFFFRQWTCSCFTTKFNEPVATKRPWPTNCGRAFTSNWVDTRATLAPPPAPALGLGVGLTDDEIFDVLEASASAAMESTHALGAAAAAVEGPDGGSSLMFLGLKDAASGAALVSVVDLMKNAEVSRVALPAELSLVELVACA